MFLQFFLLSDHLGTEKVIFCPSTIAIQVLENNKRLTYHYYDWYCWWVPEGAASWGSSQQSPAEGAHQSTKQSEATQFSPTNQKLLLSSAQPIKIFLTNRSYSVHPNQSEATQFSPTNQKLLSSSQPIRSYSVQPNQSDATQFCPTNQTLLSSAQPIRSYSVQPNQSKATQFSPANQTLLSSAQPIRSY